MRLKTTDILFYFITFVSVGGLMLWLADAPLAEPPKPIRTTLQKLKAFRAAVSSYLIGVDRPAPFASHRVEEVLNSAQETEIVDQMLGPGWNSRDGYGNKIVIESSWNGTTPGGVIRSYGPNGRDDGGKGDDMEVRF